MSHTHQTTRIWDLPTRLFHIGLIGCVFGLFLSAEFYDENLQIHFYFGYTTLTLLIFRVLWGFLGGYWSRFASFVPTPLHLISFIKGLRGASAPSIGHNPLGALSVLAMMTLLLAQVLSGFFSYDDVTFAGPWHNLVSDEVSEWLTNYHAEVGKSFLLALIALHISSILFYKRVKHEDLITPMIHGDKLTPSGTTESTDTIGTRLLALGLLMASAAVTYWLVSLGG